ncbi:PGF-CTERM sorting domain-containing protein [Halobacterium sp. CBA1126]|uniref:PGF-CTERM sorting domain-containing protein n=1 Tax=Halobacterium sp. CBA1126 TaxID=2668074 RepID=UPI0018D2129C|nr:PGF-CTERM sorting domain-containing protein [Halobacterium sp. CBA1126]
MNVSDDLSSVGASSNGEVLTIGLGGSYDVDEGDELVVVYEDVQHPEEAGSYVTPLDVNPQSSGGETTATLTVGSGTSDDTPTTEGDEQTTEPTTDDATTDGGDATTAAETTEDDSNTGLPGFGLGIAVVAVAAAALLAVRD